MAVLRINPPPFKPTELLELCPAYLLLSTVGTKFHECFAWPGHCARQQACLILFRPHNHRRIMAMLLFPPFCRQGSSSLERVACLVRGNAGAWTRIGAHGACLAGLSFPS